MALAALLSFIKFSSGGGAATAVRWVPVIYSPRHLINKQTFAFNRITDVFVQTGAADWDP